VGAIATVGTKLVNRLEASVSKSKSKHMSKSMGKDKSKPSTPDPRPRKRPRQAERPEEDSEPENPTQVDLGIGGGDGVGPMGDGFEEDEDIDGMEGDEEEEDGGADVYDEDEDEEDTGRGRRSLRGRTSSKPGEVRGSRRRSPRIRQLLEDAGEDGEDASGVGTESNRSRRSSRRVSTRGSDRRLERREQRRHALGSPHGRGDLERRRMGVQLSVDLEADCVAVENHTATAQSLTGWSIQSERGGQVFHFKDGAVLERGAKLTVWSGPGAAE